MWLLKMAWKNIWRNRHRSIITMSAIFFAVILSTLAASLKDGIFENLVKNVVSFYTGYIQVHKNGYWEEQILDNSFDHNPGLEEKILQTKNVTTLCARLESFALASSASVTKGCLVLGIQPEKENRITALKKKLVRGRYLSDKEDNGILISEGLLERLKLSVGDTIVLIGQGYHGATAAGKYPIHGVVRFGSPDLNDKTLFMNLPMAQELYGAPGKISSLVLALRETSMLQTSGTSIKTSIGNEYEVMSWEEMIPDIKQHIETDSNNMVYVQGILYMLISFGIFGTQLMMMVERKFEMGMLVAVGMKKTWLILLLILESVLTVIAGCIAGMLASIPIVFYLNRHPIQIAGEAAEAYRRFGFEAIFPASTEASNFVYQALIVLMIGIVVSLYPVYKVMRLNPVNAMRRL